MGAGHSGAGQCEGESRGNWCLGYVVFQQAPAEELPFASGTFDVVICDGAFSLIPVKPEALGEVYRVLRVGGRLMIADRILVGQLPKDREKRTESWFR